MKQLNGTIEYDIIFKVKGMGRIAQCLFNLFKDWKNYMLIRKAKKDDINILVDFRLAYLEEDTGGLTAEQRVELSAQLHDYFPRHLDNDMTAYFAEVGDKPVSTIFLVRLEKPANIHFMNGKTAYLMNVYTYKEHRCKGYASLILERLFEEAKAEGITCIDVSSTTAGRALYLKNGFVPRGNTEMRLEFLENRGK